MLEGYGLLMGAFIAYMMVKTTIKSDGIIEILAVFLLALYAINGI